MDLAPTEQQQLIQEALSNVASIYRAASEVQRQSIARELQREQG
jgi:hypothetical protein